MKLKNEILQAAIAAAFVAAAGSSVAGTLATNATKFAAENFKVGGTNIVLPTTVGALTYSTSSSTTLNPSATVYLTLRLNGATFATTMAGTQVSMGGNACLAGAPSAASCGASSVLSTDKSTMVFTIQNNTAATTTLGLSALKVTPAATDLVAKNATMGVAGGAITADVALTLTAPTAYELTNAMPTTIDAPAVSGATVATSVQAITAAVSGSLGTYAAKIDLTATPVSSDFTDSTGKAATAGGTPVTRVTLGKVTYTESTALPKNLIAAGGTYLLNKDSANGTHTATFDVTPGAGQSFPVGSVLSYETTGGAGLCTTVAGALTAFTATTGATKATLTILTADLVNTAPLFVCMTKPSTGNTVSPITPTINATLTANAAADQTVVASGTGYALTYNGSQVDIRSYVPAANTGYTSYARVVNTGTVASDVSVAVINGTTGVVGTAGKVVNALPAGGAVTLDATQIEAVTGAIAATDRPRLRFTASTNGMNVQSFMSQPNGTVSDMTGAQ